MVKSHPSDFFKNAETAITLARLGSLRLFATDPLLTYIEVRKWVDSSARQGADSQAGKGKFSLGQ